MASLIIERAKILKEQNAEYYHSLEWYIVREQEIHHDFKTGEITSSDVYEQAITEVRQVRKEFVDLIHANELELKRIEGISIAFTD